MIIFVANRLSRHFPQAGGSGAMKGDVLLPDVLSWDLEELRRAGAGAEEADAGNACRIRVRICAAGGASHFTLRRRPNSR